MCIITKNESEKLKRCIKDLVKYPFQIVIVDTGSTDDTRNMLSKLQKKHQQIKMEYFDWIDDFAAARNYAISKAQCEMILTLDSDEYIDAMNLPKLLDLLHNQDAQVGRIRLRNKVIHGGQTLWNDEWVNRIFPKSEYHYEGTIHEQLVRFDGKDYKTYEAPVQICHDGYVGTEEQRQQKAYRNIRLLEQEICRTGEDPYLLYQIGKGYYMAGEYTKAVDFFAKGLSFDLNPRLEYVIDMVETYGYALLHAGQARTALQFENICDEFGTTADFHILMGFIYMNNEFFDKAIDEFIRATGCKRSRMEGANTYIAYYNAGVVKECLGHIREALQFYQQCGNYAPALQRTRELENK